MALEKRMEEEGVRQEKEKKEGEKRLLQEKERLEQKLRQEAEEKQEHAKLLEERMMRNEVRRTRYCSYTRRCGGRTSHGSKRTRT